MKIEYEIFSRIRVGTGPVGPDKTGQERMKSPTDPDETGLLPAHGIEMNACISKFFPPKATFIRFFVLKYYVSDLRSDKIMQKIVVPDILR